MTAFWLEISVEADTEAVEAVSEILGRVAPTGTSVEPGFELVDEGLGARVDPARSAIVRAYVEASDPEAVERTVEEVTDALGHLQVFDLRPIGEVTTRLIDEADWAEEWKRHFPVLRVGRRLVIRPTWRRHRAAEGDVVLALDPGMAFGTGLHPTTRLCLSALERTRRPWRGRRAHGPRRRLRIGDPGDRRHPARCRVGARYRHRSDRDRGHDRERAPEPDRQVDPRARGQRPDRRGAVRCGPGEPHRLAARAARSGPPRGARAGRHAAGIGDLRRSRGRGPRRVRAGRAARSRAGWRRATGLRSKPSAG